MFMPWIHTGSSSSEDSDDENGDADPTPPETAAKPTVAADSQEDQEDMEDQEDSQLINGFASDDPDESQFPLPANLPDELVAVRYSEMLIILLICEGNLIAG